MLGFFTSENVDHLLRQLHWQSHSMGCKGDSSPNVAEANNPPVDVLQSAGLNVEQMPLSGRHFEAGGSQDSNIVNWDGSDDPEHPTNWKASKMAMIVTMVSTIMFLRFVEWTFILVCKLT